MRVIASYLLTTIGVVLFGKGGSCWVDRADHVVDFIRTRNLTGMRAGELHVRK